jgi:hypothetical protein
MSKLANIAFSRELARREWGVREGVVSNAVHPGVVATEMLRRENFDGMLGQALGGVAYSAAQMRNLLFAYSSSTAALTVLHCAVAPHRRSAADKSSVDISAQSSSKAASTGAEKVAEPLGSDEGLALSGAFFVPVATRWAPHHPKAHDPVFGEALWGFAEALVQSQLAR